MADDPTDEVAHGIRVPGPGDLSYRGMGEWEVLPLPMTVDIDGRSLTMNCTREVYDFMLQFAAAWNEVNADRQLKVSGLIE